MIRVQNLFKSFGRNQQIPVLKGVTIEFPKQGLIVLLGQSGSGKTTFLNIMGGLEKPTEGTISYGEKTLSVKNQQAWDAIRNAEIGYIFQNYHLIPGQSVYDNVALSLRILGLKDEAEIERRVLYTLRAVGMHHFRGRLVSQLSGGQQQRIAIARAIVKNPKVILADEPTGNLDSRNTYEIMSMIKKISETRLVILVSHEKLLVSHFADRIIEIKDGQILKDYQNINKTPYAIDDHTIFIKDLKEEETIKDDHWHIDTYRESSIDDGQYQVTLVMRNGTLYVEAGESIQNVRVVNKEANIQIEREMTSKAYEEANRDTSFDLKALENVEKKHGGKSFISIARSIKDAFFGLFNVSKKTSLMLSVFFLMGMVMALGIPFINNVNSNRMIFASDQRNYISVTGMIPSGANYRLIESLAEPGDDSFYINVYRQSPITIEIPSLDTQFRPQIPTQLGISEHLDESMLVLGRLPEATNEMVVDFSIILADYQRSTSVLRRAGIWSYDQIIGRQVENLYVPDQPFVITGIVNAGSRRVFVPKTSMVYLGSHQGHEILTSEFFEDMPGFTLLDGHMPTPYNAERDYYEVLVPESFVDRYPGLADHDFDSETLFDIDFKVNVAGIYRYDGEDFTPMILLPADDHTYRLYQYTITQVEIFIYSNNPSGLIVNLENTFNNAQMSWPYQIAQNEGRVFLLGLRTLMILGILLIVLSFVSIYFMLKSSLASQIQEISVYRALGVRKIDILKKYVGETMVRLTATSTLGYLLFTIFVDRIDAALVGGSYYFLVTPASVMIGLGLIYLIGLLGMIPVYRLLMRSPAQLLTYYDI